MAETLKFGPQWLHNLLDGGQGPTSPPGNHAPTGLPLAGMSGFTGPGTSRTYKLAEHRYGREEMLALYMPAPKIPEGLRQFQSILKEQALQPMAFIPLSEEEQRLMSQSVNSVAVLRMMGRGTGGPAVRGGRGGGDRGRGRGRGRGEGGFAGFHRQTSLEDEGVVEKQRGFERGAIGFGGPRSGAFEEGPTSPRRDFSRSMSSDNWRDARGNGPGGPEEEEGGDWRRAGPRDKWGTRGSWRDHRERDRDRDFGRAYDDYEGGRGGSFDRPYRTKSGSWGDGPESDLPEWSTSEADDMENIGTFDSSGAFCFSKDRDVDENEQRRRFEAGRQRALAAGRKDAVPGDHETENGADTQKDGGSVESEQEQNQEQNRNIETADKENAGSDTQVEPVHAHSKNSQSTSTPITTSQQQQTGTTTASPKEDTPPGPVQARLNHPHSNVQEKQQQLREPSPPAQELPSPSQPSHSTTITPVEPPKSATVSSVQTAPVPSDSSKDATLVQQPPTVHQQSQHRTRQERPQPSQQGVVDDDFGHLEKAAEDLVATWTAEEDAKSDCKAKVESGGVPLDHEDAKKWFYRDPQGDLQGPFKAAEMAEWFSAGYFTMNLLVKRGCDGTFQALGELIKRWGRVPFLPGPSPPPLKDPSSLPIPTAPQPDPAQEQLLQQQKMMQQQMIIQQQMYLQQVQMSQMIATQQQKESFAKLLPQQQQQQIALQFMLKHQQQLMGQQASGPGQPTPGQHSPPQQQPQPGPQQPPPSMSPRAEQQVAFQRQLSQQQVAVHQVAQQAQQAAAQQAAAAAQQQVTTPGVSQAGDAGVPGFHRSVSQPHSEENTIWGSTNPPSSASWTTPTSVWDIEQTKAQSVEEIKCLERIKIEQQQREEVERRENERLRQEDEMRKRQEEEERRRQEKEVRRRQEEHRKQVELEREHIKQLERIRLQRESEESARRDEERRRREEEERRRQEQEEQRLREAEERRRLLDEQRRKEQEELERKRQEEIRRRQEKAEEMRRQQQESLRRLQQEQLANMQLPSTAQWGSSATGSAGNGTPSLSEIQEMESARAAKESEEKKCRLDLKRQQLAAIQQQQQQQNKTWAQQSVRLPGTSSVMTLTSSGGAPSLLEIQQEQALQLERDKQQRHSKASTTAALPLRTAAVWSGAAQATHWAAEGAWGNLQSRPASAGFWDDAIGGASTKKTPAPTSSRSMGNGNSNNFPSLSSTVPAQQVVVSNKLKPSKAKREEESVQRLFQQAMKPKDEFTQWCENALRGIQSSVDVPTFIVFLQDVESPYEVHDYVRSYLGESKDTSEFATQFLERRSKYKNHLKQPEQTEICRVRWTTVGKKFTSSRY